ncbi:TolC family protein [Mucilaginibacter sp. UR6-1]|uniref:TolC family protein n=1 Tax=Mucilaginibacter sp. UR6-1 TaxID=1435643 RepID=UPI001E4601E1|nr:TolC family protein [Mucilaginibacter sp. UR6-1]MCC8408326.1 TolC family protein [Mucilaginibacter sp. UR6-1]
MNRKILIILIALLPFKVMAQPNWSLKACIEYGLKNNRSNAVYANEKKIADAQAKEALADYLPKLSLTGTLDNNLKVQETVIPAGVFGPEDQRVAFTKKYNTNGVAQVDQTIYDQSLLTGLKANRYNVRQAGLNQQQNDEAIIYNISTAYYQIMVYREQLSLLKVNTETYRKQIEVSALKVKKGVALQKDLDKVTVDLNNALSQIRVAESNLTLAENQLKYEMGYPITDALQVEGNEVIKTTANVDAIIGTSRFLAANRTDYRIAEVNTKLLEIDEDRIKAGFLPKLTAYARYGAVGFGDQLSPAFSGMSTYSAVGLKLTFPIFDFFKRNAQYSQAKYKRLNAQENLKLNEGKYQLEYENARTKLVKEQSNVDNNRRNIELARSVFATTDLQFQKGTTDLTDWLNAQNSLKEAQNNYLSSLYQFYLAKIDLEKAGGTLKNFYSAL